MLFLQTALHWEAKPFIDHLRLRKDVTIRTHEVYRNENTCLVVSGIGKVPAAAASAIALSTISHAMKNSSRRPQGLLPGAACSIGMCGASSGIEVGTPLLINKITDLSTKKRFYPDLLIRSTFRELPLFTADEPVTDQKALAQQAHQPLPNEFAVDMEASAFFETCGLFFPRSALQVIKVVSDNLVQGCLSAQSVYEALHPQVESILEFLQECAALHRSAPILDASEIQILEKFAAHLRLSMTQQQQLEEWSRSYKVRHKTSPSHFFLPLPEAKDKQARNRLLEQIRYELFTP